MKRLVVIDEFERPSTFLLLKALERRLEEALDLEDPYDPEFQEDTYLDMYDDEPKLDLLAAIKRFIDED